MAKRKSRNSRRVSGIVRAATPEQKRHLEKMHRYRRYKTILKEDYGVGAKVAEKLAYQLAYGKAKAAEKYGSYLRENNKPAKLRGDERKLAAKLNRQYISKFPHRIKLAKEVAKEVKSQNKSRRSKKTSKKKSSKKSARVSGRRRSSRGR